MNILNRILFRYKKNKSKFTKDKIKMAGVSIGDYTYGNLIIHKWTKTHVVSVGKFCSIADNVRIIIGGDHRIDWISTYPFGALIKDIVKNPSYTSSKGDVRIGNDVWIGRDVIILSGVTIGDGAVIAARSVVTKNVNDYEIVGGNPAKHIRLRFNKDQIDHLKKVKWWNWSIEKINKHVDILESSNIEKLPID
jgi:acetyltransferase-like isoleucine patch superfamily enzyme